MKRVLIIEKTVSLIIIEVKGSRIQDVVTATVVTVTVVTVTTPKIVFWGE